MSELYLERLHQQHVEQRIADRLVFLAGVMSVGFLMLVMSL